MIDRETLEQQIERNGGDLEIDSEEGAGIAHGLEGDIGRELIARQDLKREKFTSIARLAGLLDKNLQGPPKKSLRRSSRKQAQ